MIRAGCRPTELIKWMQYRPSQMHQFSIARAICIPNLAQAVRFESAALGRRGLVTLAGTASQVGQIAPHVVCPKARQYAPIAFAGTKSRPPKWIKPQLARLADEAPAGEDWVHGISTTATASRPRLDGGQIKLLTRTGLDWSHRYRRTIEALRSLPVKAAYLDGELCALNADGVPVFSRLQVAMDEGRTDQLVCLL
jgi:hypothetical protein